MVFRGPWRQRAVQSSALVCGSVILLVSVNQESIGGGTSLVSVEEPPTPDPPSPSPGGFAPRECRDRSLNAILRRKVEEPIERPVNDSWRSILQQCVRPQGTIGDYIELLPPEDTSKEARELLDEFAASRYNSCAVVGSGGSLHGSGLGAQIDSHDLVIRMNHHVASEAGREDIGCKTTFHALHPPNAGNVFQRLWKDGVLMPLLLERGYYSGHWLHCLLEPGGFRDTCTCMLNRSQTSWHEYYKHVHPSSFQRYYNGKAVKPECIYEPEFPSWRARPWAWIGGKRKIDRGHPCVRAAGLKRMPSSGFRSMILSMHFCNYVHLYGMADSSDRYDKNPSSPSNETNASRRSYNSIHKKHDFGGEHRFFRLLRSKSVLFQPDAT